MVRLILILSFVFVSKVLFSQSISDILMENGFYIEKFKLEQKSIVKKIEIQPKKRYRFTLTGGFNQSDKIILNVKDSKGNIIGSSFDELNKTYYDSFDIICDKPCDYEYIIEIIQTEGENGSGEFKIEMK